MVFVSIVLESQNISGAINCRVCVLFNNVFEKRYKKSEYVLTIKHSFSNHGDI